MEDLSRELKRRESILKWMVERDIRSYGDVANVVRRYYLNPGDVYNTARLDIGW